MQTSVPSFPPLEYHDGVGGDSIGNDLFRSHGGFNSDAFAKSRRNMPEQANIIFRQRHGVPAFSQQDNQQSAPINWEWARNRVADEQQKLFNTRTYGSVDSNSGYYRKVNAYGGDSRMNNAGISGSVGANAEVGSPRMQLEETASSASSRSQLRMQPFYSHGLPCHLLNNQSKFHQPVALDSMIAHPSNLNNADCPDLHSQNLTGIPKHEMSYDTQVTWRGKGRGIFPQQFGGTQRPEGVRNVQFQQLQSLQFHPQQSFQLRQQHFLRPQQYLSLQSQQCQSLQSQQQFQEMRQQLDLQELEHYKQLQLQQESQLQVPDTSYSALLHGPDTPPSQPDPAGELEDDNARLQGASFSNVAFAGPDWAFSGLPHYRGFSGSAREGDEPLVPIYPEKRNVPQEHFDGGVKVKTWNVLPDPHNAPGNTQVQVAHANSYDIGNTQSNKLGGKQHIYSGSHQRATDYGKKLLSFEDKKHKVWISNASLQGSPDNEKRFPVDDSGNKQKGHDNLRQVQQQISSLEFRESAAGWTGNNQKSIDVLREMKVRRESGWNENERSDKTGHNQRPSETHGDLQGAWKAHMTPNQSPDIAGQSAALNGRGSICNYDEVSHRLNLAPKTLKIVPTGVHTQERLYVHAGVAHQPLQSQNIQFNLGNQHTTMVKTLGERATKLVPDMIDAAETPCQWKYTEPEGPSVKKQRKFPEQVDASALNISLAHLRQNQGPLLPQNIKLGLGPPSNSSQNMQQVSLQQVGKPSWNNFSDGQGQGQDQDQVHDDRPPSSNIGSSPIAHPGNYGTEVRDGDDDCQRSGSVVLLQTPVASVSVPSPAHMLPFTEADFKTPAHAAYFKTPAHSVTSFKNFGGEGSLQTEHEVGGNQSFHSIEEKGSALGSGYSQKLPSGDYFKPPSSDRGDYSSHCRHPMHDESSIRQVAQDERMMCITTQQFGEMAHVATFCRQSGSSLPGQLRFVPCHERAPFPGVVEAFHMPSGGSHGHVMQINSRPQMPTRRLMGTASEGLRSTPGSHYFFEEGNSQAKQEQEKYSNADPTQLATSNFQTKCQEPSVCFSSPIDATMPSSFQVGEKNEDQANSRQSIQFSYSKPPIPVLIRSDVSHGDRTNITGAIGQQYDSEFASLGHTLQQNHSLDDNASVSAGINNGKTKDSTFMDAQVAASVSVPYLGVNSNEHVSALQMTSYHSFSAVSRALPDSQERMENALGWPVSYDGQMHHVHVGVGKCALGVGESGILRGNANSRLDQISRHHFTNSRKLFSAPVTSHLKKRKKPVSLLIPWHVAASQPRGQLPSTSEADVIWANAMHRLPDKDDVGSWDEGTSSVFCAKRRLRITTQLMQQLVQPLPRKCIYESTAADHECATYYVAKFTLGEACRIVAGVEREAEVTIDNKNKEVVCTKAATVVSTKQAVVTKLVERLMDNARRLDGELTRLDCSIFVSDLKLKTQDLEKLSVVNRLAKHNRTSFSLDTSSQNVFIESILDLGPEKYATAVPLPRTLPDDGRCLSL